MTQALSHLSAVMEQWQPEERLLFQGLCASSSAMKADADVLSLVQGVVFLHGPAPSPTVYTYLLPCSLDDIREGRTEGNPRSVFRTTIQKAMELQPGLCDGLAVPRVLAECVLALRRNEGLSSEGIFRLSPSKTQFDEAKAAVDSGDYTVLDKYDAYVSAALIKDWLRSLREPIIPDALYEEAVGVAQGDAAKGSTGGSTSTTSKASSGLSGAMAVWSKLDVLSQDVLRVIGNVVQDTTASWNEKNLMSYHSLSIVFAPCLLRCASVDPSVVFANTRHEVHFTLLLLQALQSPRR